ncbi:response regulator transcription factor [Paraneptunicella aestuarii]|uniref:response regulator transcription factor n=1 Tax=Paraneptunicella aestuarii TaxID=2831148 RepID=UPI001E459CA5|nr:response regulator transcription factor [Paraneptunicella aestuarii]UAA37554.1 response regulator transcription factor [Paraneptunicella aestuarii]
MITLLIADDHPLYRDALRGALNAHMDEVEILEASDMGQAIEQLQQNKDIDLLLLDLHMPGSQDLFGLIHIRKTFPDLPVAVVSGSEDKNIISKVIDIGALGFVPKTTNAADIAKAIQSMLEGEVWLPENFSGDVTEDPEFAELADKIATLTPAQYKVLCMLRDGLLNKQIGYSLGIAEKTVKTHITSIFKKLDISNRTQAVIIATQLQLEAPSGE